ncbi:MAG: trehalose-phosphatase [Deltaproteobacteria bacterium]|nr:trehalose-phosphatase [Deltaproteobacteria bacterium]
MIPLLGREGEPLLRALAGSSSLLAFDFDGTLAPIVDDRRRAALRPRTRALLARTATLFPCAVITGRARADVARRVSGTGVAHLIGNHGLEVKAGTSSGNPAVRRAHALLREVLRGAVGVDIEDKGATLAVHYRRAPEQAKARARIVAALAPLSSSLRLLGGHCVLNVLPAGAGDKGTAFAALWDRLGADVALFVGDDLTDEPAFELALRRSLIGAYVGASEHTSAGAFLRDQLEVDLLLERLVELRLGHAKGRTNGWPL